MSGREGFVQRFGEKAAAVIETAARGHRDPFNLEPERGPGTDSFRWAVIIAIGNQCMEIERYRDYHKFTPPWSEVKAWLLEPAQREWLAAHDGDLDYLAAMAGMYREYMPKKSAEDPTETASEEAR